MTLDTGRFREILMPLHPGPVPAADAEVILELAQLCIDSDGREDADEIQSFFALGKAVFAMAGLSNTPTPTSMGGDEDNERMRELSGQLSTTHAKELAFACAHLLSISDIDIAPEEDAFIGELRDALSISVERGDEIAAQLNAAVTPPG
ncbi:MAG: hypothetical protein AB7T06_11650 [Kofleriaceae bacterium]